ncbi:hypothetical protein BE17_38090 [Sorangium cellulosum]|uniref:Uncharacterized protein n=1 Tax=Sorangium cellulosum TaxID=56 RepID=A0A150RDL4_SORCE|nr:hypothetical protein BE17_38090 [Sorangium cellulosum]
MRPNSSVHISSPRLPTTTAVCAPAMTGFGVTRAGRNGVSLGIASKEFWYSSLSAACETARSRCSPLTSSRSCWASWKAWPAVKLRQNELPTMRRATASSASMRRVADASPAPLSA